MSKQLSPVQSICLTLLALTVMFVLRRLGIAGRSVKSSVHDVRGPLSQFWSDIVDGPIPRRP